MQEKLYREAISLVETFLSLSPPVSFCLSLVPPSISPPPWLWVTAEPLTTAVAPGTVVRTLVMQLTPTVRL